MTCLDAAEIARALTTGDDDPHLGSCLDCRRRLEADREARDALRRLPLPTLTPAHRKALAAEVIALAQHRPRRRTVRVATAAAGTFAVAATIAAIAWWPRPTGSIAITAPADHPETIAMPSTAAASDDSPPALSAPAIEAALGASFKHVVGGDRDVVTVVDGVIAIDTRASRKVDVVVGDSVIRVDDAVIAVEVHQRAIVSLRVVVGAARVDGGGQHLTLQRDSLWIAGPSVKALSLTAFHDGWLALRAGRNDQAMTLFDRVTDPVALEEASYWAAIAARRAGDPSAAERIEHFLRAFPLSQYADEIRRARP